MIECALWGIRQKELIQGFFGWSLETIASSHCKRVSLVLGMSYNIVIFTSPHLQEYSYITLTPSKRSIIHKEQICHSGRGEKHSVHAEKSTFDFSSINLQSWLKTHRWPMQWLIPGQLVRRIDSLTGCTADSDNNLNYFTIPPPPSFAPSS